MDVPFALRFFKKIELFQTVKKLDGFSSEIWGVEKKVLFWAYQHHKHLGSPITIDSLRTKKAYVLKMGFGNSVPEKNFQDHIKKSNADELESLEAISDAMKTHLGNVHEYRIKTIQENRIGHRLNDMGIQASEIENVGGVRKVFGNLVSRGHARFYPPDQQEVFDKMVRVTENMSESQNKLVPVEQSNCDGITISEQGLLVGELLTNLYRWKCGQLKRRNHTWFFYNFLIYFGYFILFVALLYTVDQFTSILFDRSLHQIIVKILCLIRT